MLLEPKKLTVPRKMNNYYVRKKQQQHPRYR